MSQSQQNKIFIGNLSYSVDEEALRTVFEVCGTISDIAIPKDRETKKARGFAFVTFDSEAAVAQALAMNGQEVGGRNISVKEAEARN